MYDQYFLYLFLSVISQIFSFSRGNPLCFSPISKKTVTSKM